MKVSTSVPLSGANITSSHVDEQGSFQERIARRAFELWQKAGCLDGRESSFWCEAERQLSDRTKTPDGLPSSLE